MPVGAALLLGTQSVLVEELVAFVDGDMPLDVVLEPDMLPVVDALLAAESLLVGAVTPVPLAPFVVFSPVNRCSGFVAVLRVESVAAPVVAVVLGLMVVVDE